MPSYSNTVPGSKPMNKSSVATGGEKEFGVEGIPNFMLWNSSPIVKPEVAGSEEALPEQSWWGNYMNRKARFKTCWNALLELVANVPTIIQVPGRESRRDVTNALWQEHSEFNLLIRLYTLLEGKDCLIQISAKILSFILNQRMITESFSKEKCIGFEK